MSEPAKAIRSSGSASAANVPSLSQPGGIASHVPFANGSAIQSCAPLALTSASGTNRRSASRTTTGSAASGGSWMPKPTRSTPSATSYIAATVSSGIPQPVPMNPGGTPAATATTFVTAPAWRRSAARHFGSASGGSNVTSAHTLSGRATTSAAARSVPPPRTSTATSSAERRTRSTTVPNRTSRPSPIASARLFVPSVNDSLMSS